MAANETDAARWQCRTRTRDRPENLKPKPKVEMTKLLFHKWSKPDHRNLCDKDRSFPHVIFFSEQAFKYFLATSSDVNVIRLRLSTLTLLFSCCQIMSMRGKSLVSK